jgi:hypothetical protein
MNGVVVCGEVVDALWDDIAGFNPLELVCAYEAVVYDSGDSTLFKTFETQSTVVSKSVLERRRQILSLTVLPTHVIVTFAPNPSPSFRKMARLLRQQRDTLLGRGHGCAQRQGGWPVSLYED